MLDSKVPIYKNIGLWLVASLTLGLAPFSPPHIWDKLQWIYNGGAFSGDAPMQAMDWFDLAMHGTPWVMLLIALSLKLKDSLKK